MKTKALVGEMVGVLLAFLSLSSLAGAQGVGGIGGTVQDVTGAVIPGVTVGLSNPGTIGGNQQTITDERGSYQFTRLVPSAAYSVRASLTGFSAAIRENVAVSADNTSRVDLTLEVGEASETVTVTGEAPLLDTTSVFNQTILERQTLDVIPTGRDMWSIARMVPGIIVAKYDVGGSESMYSSNIQLHGAPLAEGGFLADGVDLTNQSGGGGTSAYVDTGMFQEVNYQAGNAPAEYEKGGVVISMVSRTGTNDFHGQYTFTGANSPMNWGNLTSQQRADLRAAAPARVLANNPNLDITGKMKSLYNTTMAVTGPVIKNKLWFSTTGQVAQVNRFYLGSYTSEGGQILDNSSQHAFSFKASWQARPGTQVHFIHNHNKRSNPHRTATALTIANDFYEQRAMTTQFLPTNVDVLRMTSTLSPKFVLEVSINRFRTLVHTPAQPEVKSGDIPRYDAVTNTYLVAYPTASEMHYTNDPFLNASLSYVANGHDLKFGYQGTHKGVQGEVVSFSHYPAGLRAVFRNGVPDSVNTYNTPAGVNRWQRDHGLYIEDKWKTTRKLTLNLGLRLQKSYGWIPAGCQVETIFIKGQCYPEVKDVPNWLDLAPRFGLIYDVFGDGKTAFKLALNRYYMPVGTSQAANVDPRKQTNDTRKWTDTDGDLIPQLSELGLSSGFNLGTTNRYNPHLKRPLSNELSVEVEHQLFGDLVLSVGFYHRETLRNIGSKNLLVPKESYTPIVVTEKDSGKTVTVYNQDPATRGKFDVLYDNFGDLNNQYNGVDITFNKRMSSRWMVMGGLSLGRSISDVYGTADLNNPNNTFRRGAFLQDVPVAFKTSGSYEAPYGISFSVNAQHFTGFPEQDTVIVGSNTITLTQVTQSVAVNPRGANRSDTVNVMDIATRKTFKVREQLTAEPVMEVFNLFNASPVQGRSTILGVGYHRAASIMRGRMLKLGLNVKF